MPPAMRVAGRARSALSAGDGLAASYSRRRIRAAHSSCRSMREGTRGPASLVPATIFRDRAFGAGGFALRQRGQRAEARVERVVDQATLLARQGCARRARTAESSAAGLPSNFGVHAVAERDPARRCRRCPLTPTARRSFISVVSATFQPSPHLAETLAVRDAQIGEEDFVEFGAARHLLDRAHFDGRGSSCPGRTW